MKFSNVAFVLFLASLFSLNSEESQKWIPSLDQDGSEKELIRNVRVIDFGDDYIWNTGRGYFRNAPSQLKNPDCRGIVEDVDLDGDGETKDDCISYLTFSMDQPMNPADPYWNAEGINAVFYGGVTGFFQNNKGKSGFSELMINVHETPDGDNLSVHTHGTNELHRNYHVFLWKKEDFLKGGNKNLVSTDDESLIAVHVMRWYNGMDGARFVLQEGDLSDPTKPAQFYISEYDFGNENAQKEFRDSREGKVFNVNPNKTRWAKYNPKAPYDIVFDRDNAEYKKMEFKDIRSAGYYIAKHEWSPMSQGAKTYAFELFANVDRPVRASENIDMAKIKGNANLGDFYMSTCEVPYALYKKVRRPAVSQMFGVIDYYPYMTDRDGDMGSMDYIVEGEKNEHNGNEPVTDITWLDTIAWCNMLSEYEGRTPCYYFTENFDTVFRRVRERRMLQRNNWYFPKVFVKWDADGFRLPTPSEWKLAAGNASPSEDSDWIGSNSKNTTHVVGTKEANDNGLYDMYGNVWEFIWDAGKGYEETTPRDRNKKHLVLGGDFNYPADPSTKTASRFGDKLSQGNYNIGFRVVRGTGKAPSLGVDFKSDFKGSVPKWTFTNNEILGEKKLAFIPKGERVLDMVEIPEASYKRIDKARIFTSPFEIAKFEVSYAKWMKVYNWAIAKGYKFNKDGDMGSMDRYAGRYTHSPNEPVTDICRTDAIIWCNALSEMEGRKPCYYKDKNKIDKMTEANQYRRLWVQLPEKYKEPQFGELNYDVIKGLDKMNACGAYVDWSTDGYRIPTMSEWNNACRGDKLTRWYWGDKFSEHTKYAWSGDISGGKTHPVGELLPNEYGVHDIVGNVYEYCWGGYKVVGQKQSAQETWNPKGYAGWSGEQMHHIVRGGSFKLGSHDWRRFLPDGNGKSIGCFGLKSYSEIGFRPVCCKKRTHRQTGSEMPDNIQVLDINLQAPLEPLQGSTHRCNLQRTGVLYGKRVIEKPAVKWRFMTKGPVLAQPIVYRGVAYIFSDDMRIYAIDAETGKERWSFLTNGGPTKTHHNRPSSPTIKDGLLYMGDNRGYLYAIDIETGRAKWKTTVRKAVYFTGSPVPIYGAIFANIKTWNKSGGVMALHGDNGFALTTYTNKTWAADQSYAVAEGYLICGGQIAATALNLRSGERMGLGASNWGGNYNIPVVSGGKVYVIGTGICVADFRSGKSLFNVPIEGNDYKSGETQNGVSENTLSYWKDKLFFGNQLGYAYCYDAKTIKRKWRTKLTARARSAPIVCAESTRDEEATMYIGDEKGAVHALDANTGKHLWQKDLGSPIIADPWISEGVLYIATEKGELIALE